MCQSLTDKNIIANLTQKSKLKRDQKVYKIKGFRNFYRPCNR
nr:MAG TPA: hypothetical protein [Caudoviricetes sp.]